MSNEIRSLLQEKLDKIKCFYKCTQDITRAIEEEDSEKLLELLKNRQEIIKEIEIVDNNLHSLFNGDFHVFLKKILQCNGEIKKVYNNILKFLNKIQEMDEKNLVRIKELFTKINEDISHLKQTGNALKGYGFIGKASYDGAFIDTKK
ncbi:MAG TPA: flagellar protein FlgN [Thermoanaerobacterales bacterium]|nr:flagellar protein FlgN [Thermoanaerobacterales bacterium]